MLYMFALFTIHFMLLIKQKELSMLCGWHVVIVVSAFLVRILALGVLSTSGILFVVLVDVFKESKAYTALIGSFMIAFPNASGK